MAGAARPIPWREPAEVFAAFADEPGAVLLDSAARGNQRSRWSYLARAPRLVIDQRGGAVRVDGRPVEGGLLQTLRPVLGQTEAVEPGPAPFNGGLIGFIGYEAARAIEGSTPQAVAKQDRLEAWFGLYPTVAAFDVVGHRAWCVGAEPDALACRIAEARLPPPLSAAVRAWRSELASEQAETRIRRALAYIAAGDVYQVNLTQRWTGELPEGLAPYQLYQRVRARAPGPFSAFLNTGALQLASVSPERFLSLTADGAVETRPIKGTRPRHSDRAMDDALAQALLASAKDRAENLMIADLMRNDLSRVAVPGSVRAPVLCGLESFPGAHHLVSSITAHLQPRRDGFDLLAATLPGGSITGAPKVRAMQIIDELEGAPRGPYCGSLMWIGFDGALDSSILIRTLVIEGKRVTAQAGGGIVADSDPAEEVEEARVKVRPLLAALTEPGPPA